MNNELRLEKLEIVNVLLILIISISFFLLPWFKISEYFSITALNGIFRYYNVLNNFDFSSVMNFINFVFSVYLFLLYLILLFVLLAVVYLVRDHNTRQFNFYCRIDYFVNLVLCLASIVLKYTISNQITAEINSNGFGLSGYLSSYVKSIFTFGSGYYVILICSAIGVFAPYLFKSSVTKNSQVNVAAAPGKSQDDFKENPKGIDRNQTISLPNNQKPVQNYGSTSPRILLVGKPNTPIFTLPAIIGRNGEQADVIISEPSVSRIHCKLEERDGNILVTDLGSSFGTGINGNYLKRNQSRAIKNNDVLKLGDIEFQISLNNNSSATSYLSKTISKKRVVNKSTRNSLDDDYFPSREDSPKLYTEDISDVHNNLDKTKSGNKAFKERNSVLILKSISQKNDCFINKTPFVIGSDALQADLVINSSKVSNRHLKLLRDKNNFLVQNLNAADNSKLNGKLLETYKTYQLHDGDKIDFADQKFIVEIN